jgi:hypothetical protein
VPRQAADPVARWVAAMRRGDWRAAWAVNDAVLARRATPPDDPRLPYHLRHVWDGRPFEGRDVLVRCYHGLGDTLQFLRYLASLRARAASVTLEAQPALLPLLGDYQPVPFDVAAPSPPSACDIEIMELAHALRLPPDAVPPPYLSPPALAGEGRGEGTFRSPSSPPRSRPARAWCACNPTGSPICPGPTPARSATSPRPPRSFARSTSSSPWTR